MERTTDELIEIVKHRLDEGMEMEVDEFSTSSEHEQKIRAEWGEAFDALAELKKRAMLEP